MPTPRPSAIVSGPLHMTRQSSAEKISCSVSSDIPAIKEMMKAPFLTARPRKSRRFCGRAARRMMSARLMSAALSVRQRPSPAARRRSSVSPRPPQEISSRSLGNPCASSAETMELPRCPKPAMPMVFPLSVSAAKPFIFDLSLPSVFFNFISSFQRYEYIYRALSAIKPQKPRRRASKEMEGAAKCFSFKI